METENDNYADKKVQSYADSTDDEEDNNAPEVKEVKTPARQKDAYTFSNNRTPVKRKYIFKRKTKKVEVKEIPPIHQLSLVLFQGGGPLCVCVETNKIDGKFYGINVERGPRLFVPPIDGSV